MIELLHVTKRYGDTLAVDDLSFTVQPGVVTGFLGPNGAGKSTTMRLILGLDAPSAGEIRIDGRAYRDLAGPLHEVGALLEARAVHGGRSARDHLLALAQTHAMGRARVEEVLGLVGLTDAARTRVGTFSLGMCQRLGIAAALLGDPGIVILDEPTNGLDPEGIIWIRGLLRDLAAEGRTVFLSSHLMSEMALTADHLIVVGRGRLIAETTVEEVVRQASAGGAVRVRTPDAETLRATLALAGEHVCVRDVEPGVLDVTGATSRQIGEAAAGRGIVLHELTPLRASLEDAYIDLTGDAAEYRATPPATPNETDGLELAA
ncbi:MAG: type transport system ATP-binding protein [Solirubrobacteraceae bacterium]|nr:type transport system ATP-binding protein [Solirubrobacteraceae bacterium]